MYPFCSKICLMCFSLSVEISKMFSYLVHSNRSCKLFSLLWLCNSTCLFVVAVNLVVRKSQIFYSIVMFNAIYMVNHIRNISIEKKVCDSVSVIKFSINFKNYIATFIDCANWLFNVCYAEKQSCVRVVVNVFKIISVHAVAPLCNGLKSDGSVLTHRAVATL